MNSSEKPMPIRVDGVSKFFGEKSVLNGLSFEIGEGEVVAFLGSNGAGKTTTMKILMGIIDDFHGEVEICGLSARTESNAIKRVIGYVPEVAILYDALSPIEFIEFIATLHHLDLSRTRQKAKTMLEVLGLQSVSDSPMFNFSKGMKQKVLLCAGLIHNPSVVLLDEPMSGLDANSIVLIKDIITMLANAGRTVFYSSHMLDVVEKVCDRIIVLENGSVVADGSFEALQDQKSERSLERIFMQLTQENDTSTQARVFVDALDSLQ